MSKKIAMLFVTFFVFALFCNASPGSSQAFGPGENSGKVYLPTILNGYPVSRIAFYANWYGNKDIFVSDANGSNWVRLTNDSADDFYPAWSPDGTQIAFASDRSSKATANLPHRPAGGTVYHVFLVNTDGSGLVQLTTNDPMPYGDPDWSPDGQKIAYVSGEYGNAQIFTIDINNQERTRITFDTEFDWEPAWSPDSTRIAYVMYSTNADIYVVNADGTNPLRLTNHDASDEWEPDWSPDGSAIVYSSLRNGNSDIFIMNADGSGEINLTQSENTEMNPSWSSDGQWILFCDVTPNVSMKLSKIKPDGSSRTELPLSGGLICDPAWEP
jgi:TolB protein